MQERQWQRELHGRHMGSDARVARWQGLAAGQRPVAGPAALRGNAGRRRAGRAATAGAAGAPASGAGQRLTSRGGLLKEYRQIEGASAGTRILARGIAFERRPHSIQNP